MYYDNIPDIMTVDEMRKVLKIGRNKAYSLVKSGEIKSLKIGEIYRIPKRYLIDFIESACYNDDVATGGSLVTLEVV